MAATFRLAMASDTNSIEDRNALSPQQLRHPDVSRGLPRPPMLSLSMFRSARSPMVSVDANPGSSSTTSTFTALSLRYLLSSRNRAPHLPYQPARSCGRGQTCSTGDALAAAARAAYSLGPSLVSRGALAAAIPASTGLDPVWWTHGQAACAV
jgi:hypothetical protein